jgi:adenylate cyclase
MLAYTRTQRRAHEQHGGEAPGTEIPLPGLANAESQVAVPAMVLGQLVGVVAIESTQRVAFDDDDEATLAVVASLVASAVEIDRNLEDAGPERVAAPVSAAPATTPPSGPRTKVRFFPVDGSTFLDGDYLIKGVAGRILWKVLGQYEAEQRREFTNKEMRLDPALELPDFRDNFESRLVLLKRRLDERDAPIRIEKTGRGRFRVLVDGGLELESVTPP